jgi:hypothetical protein
MFIHSNEKPLVCNICHKAFRYPSALSKYILPSGQLVRLPSLIWAE